MIITSVEGIALRTCSVFVRVTTSDGVEGFGECYSPRTPEGASWLAAFVSQQIGPLLVGRDPLEVDQLWHLMYYSYTSRHGDKGIQMHAISGVDIALWDIMGKVRQSSISTLLGGCFRSTIPLYASIGGASTSSETEILKTVEQWTEQGFQHIKVRTHWGAQQRDVDPERDYAIVRSIRSRFGDRLGIAFDANNGYSRAVARRQGARLERLAVDFFEEPVRYDDYEGLATLSSALGIPISAGEQEYTRWHFSELMLRGRVAIVQPDVTKCGGITEMRRIADLSEALGRRFVPHCNHSTIGFAACLQVIASRHHTDQAYEFVGRETVLEKALAEPISIEDGYAGLPAGNGHGLRIDSLKLEELAISR
jgi:L-alanine-DL-glutamate epimerase-like enolase superfamily enzyme